MKLITFLAGLLLSFSVSADITLSPVPVGTTSVVTHCIPVYAQADGIERVEGVSSATSGLVVEARIMNFPVFTYTQAGGTLANISDVENGIQDDGGVFTDDTTDVNDAGTVDFLFPATPANGDALLVGYLNPYNGFKVAVGQDLDDATGNMITWRYWDGGSWEEVSGLIDDTDRLETPGLNSVSWDIPTDWVAQNINSQGLNYYIRIEINGDPSVDDPQIDFIDIFLGNYNTPDVGDVRLESDEAGCIQLHFEDSVWAVIGSKAVSIYVSDGGTSLMDAMAIVSQDTISIADFIDDFYEELAADHKVAGTIGAQISTKIDTILDASSSFSGITDSGTLFSFVDAALTEADARYWAKGNCVKFTSGNIAGQSAHIDNFIPGSDTIEFSPGTTQAVGTIDYLIIPCYGGP